MDFETMESGGGPGVSAFGMRRNSDGDDRDNPFTSEHSETKGKGVGKDGKFGFTSPTGSYHFDMDAFENALRERGVLQEIDRTFNLVAIPLLLIALLGTGFLLVWAQEILVPFVIALFFTYLLKPMVNALSQPLGACSETNCIYFFSPQCRRRPTSAHYLSVLGYKGSSDSLGDQEFEELRTSPDELDGDEKELSSLMDVVDSNNTVSELRLRGSTSAHRTPKRSAAMSLGKGGVCFRCRHAKCPRWFSILLCVVLVVGFFSGVIVLIGDAVQTFEDEDLEQFEERMAEIAISLKGWLKVAFGLDLKSMIEEFKTEFQWAHLTKAIVVSVINGLEYVFLVFLFVLYMLFEDDSSNAQEHSISSSHSRARNLRKQIDHQIQRYIVIKTLISLCVGISVYLVLGPILGVKMAHIFGVITFFANYIPNVGAMLATCVPIPLVILDTEQTAVSAILAVLLPVSIHAVVGNIIEPKVFGDTMELHPVVVLISLSFWYTVWGIPGAILSVPITAVMRIVLSNIQHPYASVILCLLEGKLPGSKAFHGIE